MCGIAGILTNDPSAADAVSAMVRSIRHRGPDAQQTQVLPGAALGHARLSIIDLAGGGQPMQSADGRCWIVFNGEIYNYRDIREELEKAGVRFRTHSDTEVLMEFVRRHGTSRLAELNGMFSFALWDTEAQMLTAGRDRLGKKPFYFAKGRDGSWVFGSEMRAVLASGRVEKRIDPDAVDAYLALGYLPPNQCIFAGIEVLPPAHALTWRGGAMRMARYWWPSYKPSPLSHGEAVEELRALLKDAVRIRLMASDVPVGAFLSGGFDSSTVVALAQRQSAKPLQTFSIRIKDHGKDETPFARAVARQEGCEHHEIELDLDVVSLMRKMADIYDEPFSDPSNIPTHMVSVFARERLKVVLTGDGGDELFGGYEERYLPLLAGERVPSRGVRYRMLAAADSLLDRTSGGRSPVRQSRRLADEARIFPEMVSRLVARCARFNERERADFLGARSTRWVPESTPCPLADQGINRAFWFDTTNFLPGDILVKVDRAAMAVGLEPRAPILDPRIVDFSTSLPPAFKIDGRVCKKILREAFQDLWPAEVRNRSKMGFGVPEDLWLRRPDVRAMVESLLRDAPGGADRLLDMKAVRAFAGAYYGQAAVLPIQMWTLVTLLLWFERWGG